MSLYKVSTKSGEAYDYLFSPVTMDLTEKDIQQFNKDDGDGKGLYATVSLQKVAGPTPGTSYDYVDNKARVWKCPLKGWRMTRDKLKKTENDFPEIADSKKQIAALQTL